MIESASTAFPTRRRARRAQGLGAPRALPARRGWLRAIRIAWLSIHPKEASFERRGIRAGEPAATRRLQRVAGAFVEGYNLALGAERPEVEGLALGHVDRELHGFAHEGAAMALALLDAFRPQARRWIEFVKGPAADHVYMAHVGAGWAVARVPWLRLRLDRVLASYDPTLCHLVADGYGFHAGFFSPETSVRRQAWPRGVRGYAARAFDQGLGRCLWFRCCASATRVARAIGRFEAGRRSDLWAGVGLAATYAGGAPRSTLGSLVELAAGQRGALAQGSAFAAKARLKAGLVSDDTRAGVAELCGLGVHEAAAITDDARDSIGSQPHIHPYEAWRLGVQSRLAQRRGR